MSYIAAAAEGERNRRERRGGLDKSLGMQKYGIDTTAQTQSNLLDFNKQKWSTEDARKEIQFNQAQDIYKGSQEIGRGFFDTNKEKLRSQQIYEDLEQGDVDADQYTGFLYNPESKQVLPNLTEWWRDEGLHLWGDEDTAYDPKYDLTVDGISADPREIKMDEELLRNLPIEIQMQYADYLKGIDVAGGKLPYQSLMSMFNPNTVQ